MALNRRQRPRPFAAASCAGPGSAGDRAIPALRSRIDRTRSPVDEARRVVAVRMREDDRARRNSVQTMQPVRAAIDDDAHITVLNNSLRRRWRRERIANAASRPKKCQLHFLEPAAEFQPRSSHLPTAGDTLGAGTASWPPRTASFNGTSGFPPPYEERRVAALRWLTDAALLGESAPAALLDGPDLHDHLVKRLYEVERA